MGKIKNFFSGLFFLLTSVCAANAGTIAEDVVKTAESQLEVRELTGRNDGAEVEGYLLSVGRKKGDAWCAAFVYWCFHQNGVKAPRSGWSPSWFPAANTIYVRGAAGNKTPAAADVIGIYFSELKRIAHVGIIKSWPEGKYTITIEGNTSDSNYGNSTREGQGVYRKRRLKSQIYKVSRWV